MKFIDNENTELKEMYTPKLKKEVLAFVNSHAGLFLLVLLMMDLSVV